MLNILNILNNNLAIIKIICYHENVENKGDKQNETDHKRSRCSIQQERKF